MAKRDLSPEAEAVLETPFTEAQMKAAAEYLGSFQFTATALYLLGQVLADDIGDARGAEIVDSIIIDMAEHEAESA